MIMDKLTHLFATIFAVVIALGVLYGALYINHRSSSESYYLKDCVTLGLTVGDSRYLLEDLNNSDIQKLTPSIVVCRSIDDKSSIYLGGYVSDFNFDELIKQYNHTLSAHSTKIRIYNQW